MYKTLEEWKSFYEKKSDCNFHRRSDCFLTVAPDNSFMQWKATDKFFYIYDTCGDAQGWWLFVYWYCLRHGIRYIVTYTFRSPKAFIRKFNVRILKEDKYVDGSSRYLLCKEVF